MARNKNKGDGQTALEGFRAKASFERWCMQLRVELRMGSARRYLDPLVELCERDLRTLTSAAATQETAALRAELDEIKATVNTRHNLRVVK